MDFVYVLTVRSYSVKLCRPALLQIHEHLAVDHTQAMYLHADVAESTIEMFRSASIAWK